MSAVPKSVLTADRYLVIERAAAEKSQYYRGEMFTMAGASAKHNLIVANIIRMLGNALVQSPCRVFASDLRVAIDVDHHYVYPDAVVVCGQAEYLDQSLDTLLNPTLVVEVLSESTERYDRGLKFSGYRSLSSIHTVMLVSQDRQAVEIYSRQSDNQWLLRPFQSPDDTVVELPHLAIEIQLDGIYLGAEPAEASPPAI